MESARPLQHTGAARRLVAGGLAVLSARLLSKLLAFALTAYLVRYLGPVGTGEYTLVFTYLGVVGVVANQGIGSVLVRRLSQGEHTPGLLIGNGLMLKLVWVLVAAGLAVGLVFVLPYSPQTRLLVVVALPVLLVAFNVDSFAGTCAQLFQVGPRLVFSASLEALAVLLWAASVVVLVHLEAPLVAFVAAQAVTGAPVLLLLLARIRRVFPLRLAVDRAMMGAILRESAPVGLAAAAALLYSQVDVMLLSLLAPEARSSIGYYGVAFRTTRAFNVVPIAVQAAVFSVLCAQYAHSARQMRATLESTQRYLLAGAVPLAALLVGAAGPVVELLYGEGFGPSRLALQLLAPSVALMWINYVFFATLISMGKHWTLLTVSATALAVNVAANLVAIPWLGFYGASLVTTLTEGLCAVLSICAVARQLGGYSLWPLLRLGLAGALMMAPLLMLPDHVALGAILGLALYAGAVFLLGAITREDLRLLRRALRPS